MNYLIVGLGSMGKRRLRNLRSLGIENIAGFDPRADRRDETRQKYGIATYADFISAMEQFKPDALVISTPPQQHMAYAWKGFEGGLHCFIEASVTDPDGILKLHRSSADTPLLIAPSCTMRHYPGPIKIKELLGAGVIGRSLNINYQTGQYLPDWHPWEAIEDYYVSARETGGCREIVPFELTWLNYIFGEPQALACVKAKLTDLNVDIDDIYHCLLSYPNNVLANITVEVISRPKATRELRILGSEGELVFSTDENCVRYINASTPDWQRFSLGNGTVETGYINPEEPYIAEMKNFVDAITQLDKSLYPNTLLDDYHVLQTLLQLEKLAGATQ